MAAVVAAAAAAVAAVAWKAAVGAAAAGDGGASPLPWPSTQVVGSGAQRGLAELVIWRGGHEGAEGR